MMTIERERLVTDGAAWRRWGPYLAERAWATVREDYSPHGDDGSGIGASHQTGWTGLVAKLLQQQGERQAIHDAHLPGARPGGADA